MTTLLKRPWMRGSIAAVSCAGVVSGVAFDIGLTPHAVATGIVLRVNAGADAAQDWASWISPRIEG